MHTFSCCLRLRGIGELRKNVVVKISQTDFNDGCTILWISKYVCCLASAFIVCLLLNVGFVGVGLKTLSHSLLIPESIEHIEYLLDPQKDVRYTLVQAQSFRVWLFVTPWARAHQALRSMRFSSKDTGIGCHWLVTTGRGKKSECWKQNDQQMQSHCHKYILASHSYMYSLCPLFL